MPTLTVTNPFTNAKLDEIPFTTESDLDRAVIAARAAFEKTKRLEPFERASVLSQAAHLLEQRRSEFAELIVAEAGKPIAFADAEVDRAITTLTAAAEAARITQAQSLDIDGHASGKGHVGFVKRFPIGVIYGITPFNFPLNLVIHKVAPAIATGNVIIIKPSPRTPLSALKLLDLFKRAGLPENQLQVVVAPNDLAMKLVEDDRAQMVSFTGSAPIGWEVKKRAGSKRATLELGGNAAAIVHEDAHLDAAIPAIAGGAYGYAGQSCISVQRILVQDRIYDAFRDRIVSQIQQKIRTGDPADRNTVVGPMINLEAANRVRKGVDDAMRNGAKLLTGQLGTGVLLPPILLENVDRSMDVFSTEIFGPVATLHRYRTFDEAVQTANDSAFGLQAGVYTQDIALAWQAFEHLDVGGVLINQVPTWRSDIMPYGGIKRSGLGREGVRFAMEEMTEPKTLVIRTG